MLEGSCHQLVSFAELLLEDGQRALVVSQRLVVAAEVAQDLAHVVVDLRGVHVLGAVGAFADLEDALAMLTCDSAVSG
ncbi:MAG TPA: hypothetical protein VFF36_00050 [Planctomycetota bacterium]|nr:hypothetical protein [Planctomycetota bacterium]